MKAILLAGGQGRRLRSITGNLPKPMVPLVGVPVLDRLLDLLRRNGFTYVCMTLCYRPEVIQEHCGDGSDYGVHLKYRIESEPRGTAGGVRACSDFYGETIFSSSAATPRAALICLDSTAGISRRTRP